MKFIPVIGNISGKNRFYREIIELTKAVLHSLINGFSGKSFGFDTMHNHAQNIKQFYQSMIVPNQSELYIDSGGYSFIKGDISMSQISKMIDCYHDFLLHETDYDYIFSLDLPLSLMEDAFNAKDNVYRYNKMSLEQSVDILKNNSSIQDKFYFVWHFKMKGQYEIWDKLYNELNLKDVIRHRAIGGMVGLHQMANIKFGPFIAMSFRCFNDYFVAQRYDQDFRLHLLGIYTEYDRLIINIIEKLFQRYLDTLNIERKAIITHDSANPDISAMNSGGNKEVFSFDNSQPIKYPGFKAVPDDILKQIYFIDENFDILLECREDFINGRKLQDISSLSPLYAYSYLEFSKYIDHIVDKLQLVDIIMDSQGAIKFNRNLDAKTVNLSPDIFTKPFIKVLRENMDIVFQFHYDYFSRNQSLDPLIHAFTDMIDFGELS